MLTRDQKPSNSNGRLRGYEFKAKKRDSQSFLIDLRTEV